MIVSRDAEKALLTERTGARAFIDSDRDGITDYDEVHISHTNPDISDTDKDGIPDGEELLARTNPNGRDARADSALAERTGSTTGADVPSRPASEGITLEDPLIAGVTQKELLSVNDVVAEELPILHFQEF